MKKVITYILSLALCAILSFSLFSQMVSAAETEVPPTVTEETSPTETLPEKFEQGPDEGIPDTRSVEPRDEDDNF